MAILGHKDAIERLRKAYGDGATGCQAVVAVGVTSSSLLLGPGGFEPNAKYLLALFRDRLVVLLATRRPGPGALVAEFARRSYRIANVGEDPLRVTFVLAKPYGEMHVRALRRGSFSVNTEAVAALAAGGVSAKKPWKPLTVVGDGKAFRALCAAYGDGAEACQAVVAVKVAKQSSYLPELAGRTDLLLAQFPRRLALIDPTSSMHTSRPPVAAFERGAYRVTHAEPGRRHIDLTVRADDGALALEMARCGDERIDAAVLAAMDAEPTT